MYFRLKTVISISLLVILMIGMVHPVAAKTDDSKMEEPQLVGESKENAMMGKVDNGNNETPGEWYAGSTPSNPVPNAPVLLFVPGLNNVAQIFWEDNDMYQTALNAGYQTAFVQLYDAGGASADMWDNGALLAEKISEISTHFNGRPITVIAYSKGGVDTQTALTYYGAWQYVDNVITLSSPHHGSQLADLAYSSSAGWLADLIGAQGDGTYSMQMGNMENFRHEIDGEPLAYVNNYYTLGGTDWGSAFSSTWFGGMYLSQYGSNDGVVTTASSSLPGGQQLAIGDWNHTTIRTGDTFSVFENYLSNTQSFQKPFSSHESIDKNSPKKNQWVDGGTLREEKSNAISVPMEDGVEGISLDLMTSQKVSEIKLIDPDGMEKAIDVTNYLNDEGVFAGSISHSMKIDKPKAGEWHLKVNTDNEDAYLLVTNYQTKSKVVLHDKLHSMNSQQLTYQLKVDPQYVQEKSLRATYHVTQSSNPNQSKTYTVTGLANLSQTISLDLPHEVYNITIDIEGVTNKGETFKRTIIDSVSTGYGQ
ncbi:hypothetical protein SAMN05216389_103262 [Oceanobacillus limi]|uniref:Triacylglycerol lipase n=1 Tax=Oceanobacillus limi TaxID=930131 RepID=A0A1I0AJI1_9BACI|nr:hypothetical protein [Oceanobacillus limi]SES93990.1 hypothetical protein SAMN05216389_103262 [Oceanobacillus limi]